jgi:hypothetical protein
VRALEESKQDEFFQLSVARPDMCTKDRGGRHGSGSGAWPSPGETLMVGIFQSNSITVRELDKRRGRERGAGIYPRAARCHFLLQFLSTFGTFPLWFFAP